MRLPCSIPSGHHLAQKRFRNRNQLGSLSAPWSDLPKGRFVRSEERVGQFVPIASTIGVFSAVVVRGGPGCQQ